jgi:hypothetical protein
MSASSSDPNKKKTGCCCQPLLKTDPEAADRSHTEAHHLRIAKVLRDLMRGGQQELRTGIASHFSPGLAALPHFQPMGFSKHICGYTFAVVPVANNKHSLRHSLRVLQNPSKLTTLTPTGR